MKIPPYAVACIFFTLNTVAFLTNHHKTGLSFWLFGFSVGAMVFGVTLAFVVRRRP